MYRANDDGSYDLELKRFGVQRAIPVGMVKPRGFSDRRARGEKVWYENRSRLHSNFVLGQF